MMSEPIDRCIAIERSGVSRSVPPLSGARNSAPCSLIVRPAASENTWNPPESVRMPRFQPIQGCRPPIRSNTSGPGRAIRWYVFARMIAGSSCSSWRRLCVLTVPRVPTGMNTGVATVEWIVVNVPRRAREPVAVRSRWNVTSAL